MRSDSDGVNSRKLTSAFDGTVDGHWLRLAVDEILDRRIVEDVNHRLLGLGPHR